MSGQPELIVSRSYLKTRSPTIPWHQMASLVLSERSMRTLLWRTIFAQYRYRAIYSSLIQTKNISDFYEMCSTKMHIDVCASEYKIITAHSNKMKWNYIRAGLCRIMSMCICHILDLQLFWTGSKLIQIPTSVPEYISLESYERHRYSVDHHFSPQDDEQLVRCDWRESLIYALWDRK